MTTKSPNSLSRDEKIKLLALLDEKRARRQREKFKSRLAELYHWQKKFIGATATNAACMLMAANRCVGWRTNISYSKGPGTDLLSLPILKALRVKGADVATLADGSIRTSSRFSAYFQGILPVVRLYLADGEFLDCSDGHRLLNAEGNYSTISQITSGQGALYSLQRLSDLQASYDAGDCQYGQLLRLAADTCREHTQLSVDALQPGLSSSSLEDAKVRIDRYSQALQGFDLLSIPCGLDLSEALCAETVFHDVLPSARLMSGLSRISQLLPPESDLSAPAHSIRLGKIYGYGEECSTDIYLPLESPKLWGGKSIVAWSRIGLQPCFDLQVQDTNTYITAGVVSHNCGKTMTGLTIDAAHLLGDYPDDWEGRKFDFAPMVWLLGYSMEKTRDLLQGVLFGVYAGGQWSGGLIPADRIVGHLSASGTTGAMRQVTVRHASGGIATCQFWSYSQGQHAIMGDTVDWYHIDEEPRDKAIFPQVLTRTATGDRGRGGGGILTFTPENGRTELVVQFMDNVVQGQYMQRATWDDAPHLTEDTKRSLLSMYPEWQRDMRSKGLPLLGAGLIFDIGDDAIKCQAFPIPDHWFIINGMDFGWDHPQAHVQLAWDKDSDAIYLIHAWKKSRALPEIAWGAIKDWAKGVPTAWPADGLQSEKSSGNQQRDAYKDAGWTMCHAHATWQAGGVGVEAGLVELYSRMEKGTFKVFSHLTPFFEEKMNYHRDEAGHIVKVADDVLAAVRYAYMMRRFAIQKSAVGVVALTPKMPKNMPVGGHSWMG